MRALLLHNIECSPRIVLTRDPPLPIHELCLNSLLQTSLRQRASGKSFLRDYPEPHQKEEEEEEEKPQQEKKFLFRFSFFHSFSSSSSPLLVSWSLEQPPPPLPHSYLVFSFIVVFGESWTLKFASKCYFDATWAFLVKKGACTENRSKLIYRS